MFIEPSELEICLHCKHQGIFVDPLHYCDKVTLFDLDILFWEAFKTVLWNLIYTENDFILD